jgi:uncharacterized protein (TIGR03435 family)
MFRLLIGAVVLAGAASGQAPGRAQTFDAAVIRANKAGDSGPSAISASKPGRFTATNTPLKFIILYAYRLMDHELIGLPDWAEDTSFDIAAVYPADVPTTPGDVRLMVQHLLRDRFGFKMHREKRVIPAYGLTVLHKNCELGASMKRSSVDCQKLIAEKRPLREAGGTSAVSPNGRRPACSIFASRRYLTGGAVTIQQLVAALQSMLARPVVDHTGLQGRFDVEAKWSLLDDGGGASPNDSPSIFYAVREQLGLRLDPHKEPFDVQVIDRITPPSTN